MRKSDMEWVEMHLQPLRVALDRLEQEYNRLNQEGKVLASKVKDVKRDHKASALAVDQACNSARSLLQQANRRMREAKIIDDDEELDAAPAETNIDPVSPVRPRVAGNRRVI